MSLSHAEATRRFYELIWPLRAGLLRTASFLASSQAEDLVQETLMKAFRAIESLDVRSNPQAWLMSILRNTRIDKLRAQARAPETVGLEDVDVAAPVGAMEPDRGDQIADPAETLEEFSDREIIRALQGLPEEIRWTLLLVDVEQMAYEQAAAIMEIPAGTAKSRVHRGRVMLRKSLVAAGAAKGEVS